jgi:hypothetical protein
MCSFCVSLPPKEIKSRREKGKSLFFGNKKAKVAGDYVKLVLKIDNLIVNLKVIGIVCFG